MLAISISFLALLLAFPSAELSQKNSDSSVFSEERSESRGELSEGVKLQPETGFKDPDRFPLRVQWSSDGQVLAYVGFRAGKQTPVTHGPDDFEASIGEEFDFIHQPVIAEEGQRIAFRVGRTLNEKRERWWVWIDGEAQHKEDWIGEVALSADGERLAYWAQPDAEIGPDGAYVRKPLVLRTTDKKKIRKPKKWDDAQALVGPIFEHESNKAFALALDDGQWFVIGRGKKRFEPVTDGYSEITGLRVANSGRALAFSAYTSERKSGALYWNYRVVFNGEALETKHVATNWPSLSSDGKHIAYKFVSFQPKMGIIVGKEKGNEATFDYVSRATWNPAGSRVAFVSVADAGGVDTAALKISVEPEPRDGEWRLTQTERRTRASTTSKRSWLRLRNPSFPKKGEHVAARAMSDAGWHAVIFNDKGSVMAEGPPHDEVGLMHFAKDGKSISYGTRDGRDLAWTTLDLP